MKRIKGDSYYAIEPYASTDTGKTYNNLDIPNITIVKLEGGEHAMNYANPLFKPVIKQAITLFL